MRRSKYPTDLSDAEWECLECHIPAPKDRGRPRVRSPREILDIGRFDLFCAITDPADEAAEEANMAECTKTFTLPGGEISVQGVEAYPTLSAPAPGEDAITGGTGKYTGVRGEQRFEPRRTRVINTFHFID